MGKSYGNSKYLLVLKDHATHYCELVVADTADSRVVTEALLAWHSRFGIPQEWISDQSTHFKNEVIAELSRRLRVQQSFTPAYCPWINGSVERVNRDILQVVRAMILEYKINYLDWVYLVPVVQSSLNHTAVFSLGNRAPVELFTGLECPTPLKEFYLPDKDELQPIPESDQIASFLEKLRSSIQEMHCAVKYQREKQRLLNRKRERGENMVNFSVGDFVLRSRVDEKQHGNKLQVTWIGPYRVVRADAHSFRVQHLVTGEESDVHASRLKLYADSLEVTEELLEHVAAQGILLAVEDLKEHKWNAEIGDYEILVGWKGLQNIEDSFEPLLSLAKEIRVLISNYVTQADDQELTPYWKRVGRDGEHSVTAEAPTVFVPAIPDTDTSTRRPVVGRKRRHQAANVGGVASVAVRTSQEDAQSPSTFTRSGRRSRRTRRHNME